MLCNLAIDNAKDTDARELHLFARRSDAHEFASVHPSARGANHHPVPLGDNVLDRPLDIGKGALEHHELTLVSLWPSTKGCPRVVADAIRS